MRSGTRRPGVARQPYIREKANRERREPCGDRSHSDSSQESSVPVLTIGTVRKDCRHADSRITSQLTPQMRLSWTGSWDLKLGSSKHRNPPQLRGQVFDHLGQSNGSPSSRYARLKSKIAITIARRWSLDSQHHHSRADLHPAVEIDHILIGHSNAARGNRTSDVFGLVGAVDAIQRVLAASVKI
jgi:hypothetical protein